MCIRDKGVSGPAGLDGFTDGMLAGAAAVPANEAAVPTLASASALASAAQTYTVRRGDTLSEIAARFGTTVNELVRLNNIADPDRIYEGDRLIIRAGAGDGDTYTCLLYTSSTSPTDGQSAEKARKRENCSDSLPALSTSLND